MCPPSHHQLSEQPIMHGIFPSGCACAMRCILRLASCWFRIIQHIPFHKNCTSWTLKLCSLCIHVWQLLSLDVPIHHISSIADYDQSLQTITRAPLPRRTPCVTVFRRVTMTHRQNDRTSSMTTAAHDCWTVDRSVRSSAINISLLLQCISFGTAPP